jgi:F-type H+-transporting ATPase subunit b
VQAEWERAILTQREAFLKELRRLSCQQIFVISKKVLSELANARLEDQLIESFITQLEELEEQKREEFKWDGTKGLNEQSKNRVEINTAFSLSEESKDLLLKKVKELINNDIIPSFHISQSLICGIELRTENKKIAWSMENYLDMLENGLKDIFIENKEFSNLKE